MYFTAVTIEKVGEKGMEWKGRNGGMEGEKGRDGRRGVVRKEEGDGWGGRDGWKGRKG